MLLTPHIVRAHSLTVKDFAPLFVGTQGNLGMTGPPPLIQPQGQAATQPPRLPAAAAPASRQKPPRGAGMPPPARPRRRPAGAGRAARDAAGRAAQRRRLLRHRAGRPHLRSRHRPTRSESS